MPKSGTTVCRGPSLTVEWGLGASGECRAREYYEALGMADRVKVLALFQRMADVGKIYDTTKFNRESEKLYVFKIHAHRFFCFFTMGKLVLIVSAYQKQGKKAPVREIARAEKLRQVCLRQMEEAGRGKKSTGGTGEQKEREHL